MPQPLDQQILDELATRLRGISVANGYYNNIDPDRVLTEEHFGDYPAGTITLELLDPAEGLDKQSRKYRNATLNPITVVAYIAPVDLDQARAEARTVLADLRKAIRGIDCEQFVRGVTGLELGGRRINRREDGSGVVVAELDLSIHYTELY